MSENEQVLYTSYDDYAQSANTLFHFMKKEEYLIDILNRQALVPRYCVETIDYLGITDGNTSFREIAILQKCFCDIPFHKLADCFQIVGQGKAFDSLSVDEKLKLAKSNTHFDYYGEYAIAFSKSWGEQKELQPVLYLNKNSQYAKNFKALLNEALQNEDFPETYSQDIFNRLAYLKPLRGIMNRKVDAVHSAINVEIIKNFHDEREWRFVPSSSSLSKYELSCIIANPNALKYREIINQQLNSAFYKDLWLSFSYDDIKYIIVPDSQARINIIKGIMSIPDNSIINKGNPQLQRNILISKILVLSDIRKDW